jgi:hypothetical protein
MRTRSLAAVAMLAALLKIDAQRGRRLGYWP